MKCSLKWLQKYVAIEIAPEELAKRITLAGTEVAHVDTIGGWENVFVGQIIEILPHPNADRLRLATVSLGAEQVVVVCGAPNLTVGDKVAFGRIGAQINSHDGGKTVLKPCKIRGVLSEGMICSEMELGLSSCHDGILVLPDDAPLGGSLNEYLGDVVFNLEVTPNRPDMLSMLGIAHEVSALTGAIVTEPCINQNSSGPPIDESVSVEIRDIDLCKRYSAALALDVKVGESPQWLKEALAVCGIRSINNVVDISNYVMMEYGQPLHFFDFDHISSGKVIIRRATDGELITTLDGVERKLDSEMLVIADSFHAIAVAGVMGGVSSVVTSETTRVLIESASFKPSCIHSTQVRLKLPSEASSRFERGISSELTIPALDRAMQLLCELCGATVAQGVIDQYPGQQNNQGIVLTVHEVVRVLGVDFAAERIADTLKAVGCRIRVISEGIFEVSPPYWRSDLRLSVDYIEEIVRVIGYDSIPGRMITGAIPQHDTDLMIDLRLRIRRVLVGFGFFELTTYALTNRAVLERGLNAALACEPLRVKHPMSCEEECLRTSLRGSMLMALSANIHREEGPICFFEVGHVYYPREGDLPQEPDILCGVMTSNGIKKIWKGQKGEIDFFDVKGVVQGLFAELGVKANYQESIDCGLMHGWQAQIVVENQCVGLLGMIHAGVAHSMELPQNTFLFEIDLSKLLPYVSGKRDYLPMPRFPSVKRDLALVMDVGVSHQQVLDIFKKFSLVKSVELFDVYKGKQVAEGKKSLAYSLVFQETSHTLTDVEVDTVLGAIMRRLQSELGIVLR